MASQPRISRSRRRLTVAALLATAALSGYFLLPDGPSYRGCSPAWWAAELERGRNSEFTHCGGAIPWTATLPNPLRGLVPVMSDEDGIALLLGDPAAAPVLLALLRHPDPRTRAFAAEGLGFIQPAPPGVRDALDVASRDDDEPEVRAAARHGLEGDGPEDGAAVGAEVP